MKQLSKRGGHSTDTRRDHEYTDWAQVRRFAADIARDLATQLAAEPASPRTASDPDCCADKASQDTAGRRSRTPRSMVHE